ncbi:hypothetical protein D9M68_271990 [compost metagenome]
MTVTLTLCETCGYDAAQPDAERPGARFVREVEGQLRADDDLAIQRTRCLMACQRHCTALLRAPGKIAYVLGDFRPEPDAAAALLDYARQYRRSDTGQVPFRSWPAGIKGHFIARIPVLD